MSEPAEELSPELKKALADIHEHGVHIAHVEGGPGEPCYSYTVGLWHSFEHPEVIVFGLEDVVARELLDALTDELDEGKTFVAGGRYEGLLVGYPVRMLTVPAAQTARWFELGAAAYGDGFPALQMVWPDKEKRWPWDEGAREAFVKSQPLLGPLPQ
ncbi:MAG: DUF4262 domain-containing protein [Planctomycetota bacterium]